MLLKYFYDQKLAHASYFVGCQATGEAIVIDPGRDIEPYLREARANNMRLIGTAETHIHADFVSGSRELAARAGAALYVSDEGDENWKYQFLDEYKHQLLKDGDQFQVGYIVFDVIHTPGHTPEHICFMLTDTMAADKPMGIFTGDFVFVGSVGRPDLLEKAAGFAETAVAGGRDLFHSLQRFKQLPDYLQIWPGHGAGSACGKGLGAVPSSTVGYEKLFNPMLVYDDVEPFIEALLDGQPEPPKYFAIMKRVNKEGPPLLSRLTPPAQLSADLLPDLIADGAQVVDVRATDAFARRFVPGVINIPLKSLPTWAGWLVDYKKPLYLIVDDRDAAEARRDLAYIGVDNIAGYFDTAVIPALAKIDHPLDSYEITHPEEVAAQIKQGEVTLLDVRAQSEWDEGHVPEATHVMLGYLPERARELVDGQSIAIICRSGNRSAIAASILKAQGAGQVMNVQGGILAWAKAGLPIVK